jgi:hypothetical protein
MKAQVFCGQLSKTLGKLVVVLGSQRNGPGLTAKARAAPAH